MSYGIVINTDKFCFIFLQMLMQPLKVSWEFFVVTK